MEPLSANDPRSDGGVSAARPARRRRHGPGLPRLLARRTGGGRSRSCTRSSPRDAEFRQRFGREVAGRPGGRRHVHRARGRRGPRRRPALAGDRVRAGAVAGRRGRAARRAARARRLAARARAWPRRCARCTPAAWCTATSSRPTCCSPADGPHVIDFGISRAFDGTPADRRRDGGRHPRLHVAGAGRGSAGRAGRATCSRSAACSPTRPRGNAPFGGGSAASVLYRVVTGRPDLTSVPDKLREVISACLAKDPKQRPELAALGAMITRAGPAVTATPTSFWPAEVAEVIEGATAAPLRSGQRRRPRTRSARRRAAPG